MSYIYTLRYVNNYEWELSFIINILDKIKNYNNKSLLIEIIEYKKNNKEMYDKLVIDYYEYLPEEYRVMIRMRNDSSFLYNKALRFKRENLDIGIDPRISIGPEIEVNNDYNIQIELSEQKGFEDFMVSRDATVPNGSEVAPRRPFYNIKEDVAKFCGLCESMKDIGYYYNDVDEINRN